MAKARNIIQRLPLAPVIAALFGVATAVLVAATPQWLFEANVASTGLGALLPDAQSPLGIKARLLAMAVAAGLVATIVWLVVRAGESLIAGPQLRDEDDELDLTSYAATLPDPVRRPILAGDELGAPLMSDEALLTAAPPPPPVFKAEAELPEQELSAAVVELEPEPVIAEPAPDPQPVEPAPDVQVAAPIFEAAPVPEAVAERPTDDNSIDGLIRRLEARLARRDGPDLPPRGGAAVEAAQPTSDWMVREGDAGEASGRDTVASQRRMAR